MEVTVFHDRRSPTDFWSFVKTSCWKCKPVSNAIFLAESHTFKGEININSRLYYAIFSLSTISMLLLACRELVGRKYSKTVSLSLVLVGTTLPQIQ